MRIIMTTAKIPTAPFDDLPVRARSNSREKQLAEQAAIAALARTPAAAPRIDPFEAFPHLSSLKGRHQGP